MEHMSITKDSVFQKLSEIDAAIAAEEVRARAEEALNALPDRPSNPFAGAVASLEALRTERRSVVLRAEGEMLAKAIVDFEAVNGEIAALSSEHRCTQDEIADLKDNPVIVRWLAAQRIARNTGLYAVWGALEAFLASDAPWSAKPIKVSDVYIVQLPGELQFTDEDRPAIRSWAALHRKLAEINQRGSEATRRREHYMREHPALHALLPTHSVQ
jgi:hypothetical protein